MNIHVISLMYGGRHGSIGLQVAGRSEEEVLALFKNAMREYRTSVFSDEEIERGEAFPLFEVDGDWMGDEEASDRVCDIEDQLNRWLSSCMDSYQASYMVHELPGA